MTVGPCPFDTVLAANRAFYEAFASGDLAAMERLWADDRPVGCIHPGWPPLTERCGVMESWREIFSHGAPPVRAEMAEVQLHGDCALVLCLEIVGHGRMSASNLFVRVDGVWRIAHHQASPLSPRIPPEPGRAGPKGKVVLH
ncbi:MAG: hypothetical protein RLY86_3168 [Pseudomonadota bacterium]|jgi:ketosteroid isomerase-like protein